MAMTTEPQRGVQSEIHLLESWKVIWQGRYTILAVVVLIVGLTFVRVSLTTPTYEASSTIEIRPEARRILPGQEQGLGSEGGGWLAEEKYFATQLEVLRSRDVAERAFRQLRLESSPRFAKFKDPVAAFQALVKVRPMVNTRLVSVSMQGNDPKETRDWVNTVADVFVKRNVDQATASFKAIMDEIQKGLDSFRTDLGTADFERLRAAASQELYVPENQQEMLKQSLQTYSDGLSKVNVEIAALEAELKSLDKIQVEKGDVMAIPRFAQDLDLQDFNRQKQGLERDLERLAADKKPRHPEYLAKAGELQQVQQKIDAQVATIAEKMRTQYAIATSNAEFLVKQIRKTEERGYQVKQASSGYEMQKTDSETKRKVYDVVAETVQRLSVGTQLIAMNNNIVVLDRAIATTRPVSPRKLFSLAIGTLVGVLFGVGLVLFMEYLDNTIRSPEDVEHYLGLAMIGLIPRYRDVEANTVKEAFQSLRTSILFASDNRDKRVVLLTSTGPQEGKSSTIAVLGRTMASAGDRVVILDGDLRRPTQHVHHRISREPGVTNYMIDGHAGDYAPFLHDTEIPNLKVFTSGPNPPNPPDIIGSTKFRDLLAVLKRDFDWVLVDSPPVATLADSVVLASMCDMMILVIKHNQNDRELIRRSLKRLHDFNVGVVGAVINNVDLDKTYHKDYYYNGYYGTDQDEQSAPKKSRFLERGEGKKVAL